jgi:hypothetical protein
MIRRRASGTHRRGDRVKRREFITVLGGVAATVWPLAARAQQQPKMLRVGFVGMQPREAPHYANFLKRMAELGYQEGRNFTFDYIQTPNVEGYERNYRESPFATGWGKLSLRSLPTSTFVGRFANPRRVAESVGCCLNMQLLCSGWFAFTCGKGWRPTASA